MPVQGIRLQVVIATALLGLFFLFGVQRAYEFSRVDQPLAEFFRSRSEVVAFAVRPGEGGLRVEVTLRPVPNLREAYLPLEEGVRAILGNRPFRLVVHDRRDRVLVEQFYRLHYLFQEAVATGRFTALTGALAAAREAGLDEASAFVDDRYLYVQLRHGRSYLYELVPRAAAAPAREEGGKR